MAHENLDFCMQMNGTWSIGPFSWPNNILNQKYPWDKVPCSKTQLSAINEARTRDIWSQVEHSICCFRCHSQLKSPAVSSVLLVAPLSFAYYYMPDKMFPDNQMNCITTAWNECDFLHMFRIVTLLKHCINEIINKWAKDRMLFLFQVKVYQVLNPNDMYSQSETLYKWNNK